MKKVILGFIAGIIFATVGTVSASTVVERVTASIRSDYSVELDGNKIELSNSPLVYSGASYLPVREITGLLGKDVNFDNGVIKITTPEDVNIETMMIQDMNKEQAEQALSLMPSRIVVLKMKINHINVSEEDRIKYSEELVAAEIRQNELEARLAELNEESTK